MSSDSHIVTVSQETAKVFSLKQVRKDGNIDLKKLAAAAHKAIEGSEKSLKVASNIADGGWIARLWNSGAFAQNVVESIGHIRDISQINLALSAICNDLAAANLQHAQKIDANHLATSSQLHDVQQLTRGLLEHLRTSRKSALLQPIAAGLGAVDGTDKEALQGWLHSFSEAIDLQYLALKDKLDQLAQQPAMATDELVPIRQKLNRLSSANQAQRDQSDRLEMELKRVDEELRNLGSENTRQQDKLATRITNQTELAAERSQSFEVTLRKHAAKLNQLNKDLEEVRHSLTGERTSREEGGVLMLELTKKRELAMRVTVSALNRHWLKRLLCVGGILLLTQIILFAFFADRTGLW